MKHLILIIILSTIFCSSKNSDFEKTLYINPGNVADSLLPILITENKQKFIDFENLLANYQNKDFNFHPYLDIIFRYRDIKLIPILYKIIKTKNINPYFKIMAIHTLGEISNSSEFDNLLVLFKNETNDLKREYLANALGKIADKSQIQKLKDVAKNETNGYVNKTLIAAIEKASGEQKVIIKYLPLIDTIGLKKIVTFPSELPLKEFLFSSRIRLPSDGSPYIPKAKSFIFPHMQYKLCNSVYDKVERPFNSFGLADVSHVGEDSGWLFEGMPVHSIANGRVAFIQHDESWGCLVCIESKLSNGKVICSYYGHLSANLDVYIGKVIEKGDKIGEIGPPFSFQNGGYRSHLHLGIEKSSIKNAIIAGYHDNMDHWYNPIEFISNRK